MTAWKIWPLPQSGTPRARVTAPLWPKTESSWVELSTLRLMGERTQHCRRGSFPRRDSRRRSLLLAKCPNPREGSRHQRAASRGISRFRSTAKPLCHGAPHGPHWAGSRPFADRGATAELSEAGTNDNYRSGGARADRSRETARPRTGALRLSLQETALRERESEQNHEEGDRHSSFPARGGLHRIRRALPQFCGRCGRLFRRQRARFGLEHRIRPRHENRSLANRG